MDTSSSVPPPGSQRSPVRMLHRALRVGIALLRHTDQARRRPPQGGVHRGQKLIFVKLCKKARLGRLEFPIIFVCVGK